MEIHEELVERFLKFACWDHHVHSRGDHRMYDTAAQRLLKQHPEIALDSLYTAVVCGELQKVERILAEDPELANEKGGPRDWPLLLYACYTRFSHPRTIENAVPIARALLDRGADPNAFYMAGDSRYTALVGVAGEGEQDSPRQPQAEALFQLLLERGAKPFDLQVLYNTHFRGDVIWWLDLVYKHTVEMGRKDVWDDPSWEMFDMGQYGTAAHLLLRVAVDKNDLRLAEWLLEHGARPYARMPSHVNYKPKYSPHETAILTGLTQMAGLLERYSPEKTKVEFEGEDRFIAACFRMDDEDVSTELVHHPEYLSSPNAIFAAAHRDRPDVVKLLVEKGVSVEIANETNKRPLHEAAANNSLRVASLLVETGAEIDPVEQTWDATPIGWAAHEDHTEMIDLLSVHSRDIWTLSFCGYVERLREVLQEKPELAKSVDKEGITPLWWLPDDEQKALEIVQLLISHGADPMLRNNNGRTAADWARTRLMLEVARALEQ